MGAGEETINLENRFQYWSRIGEFVSILAIDRL